MQRSISIIIVLFVTILFAQESKEQLFKSKLNNYPDDLLLQKINYPGDSNIDVIYYKLDLKITYESSLIEGEVTVTAKSITDGLISFYLDLTKSLTVDSVLSDKNKLSITHSSNDKLQINLINTYNAGQKFSVVVYYHGKPPQTGFGSFIFNFHDNQPIVWTLSEPYGAKDWWPCKDTPADKADSSDVWVTCSDFYTVVSNGNLETVIDNGNDTKSWKWKNKYPIAQYLISIAMTNYVEYKDYFHYSPKDSMLVVHYIFPEKYNTSIEQVKKTIDMLQIYSDIFGPYPWLDEKYGHAQFGWGGGMEHQTVASVGSFGEELVAHELAHQWYGDKITCKDWQNIWLNEGFATYAVALYYERKYGSVNHDSYMDDNYYLSRLANGSIYVQDISSVSEIFNSLRSYAKGAAVLHMLRGVVGDSIFFKIMKNYASDPSVAYGVAVTEDFQSIAERIYGQSLDYFFKEWIYGEYYPTYYIDWNSTNQGNDIYLVELNINQVTNTNPSFFTMPIQIKLFTSKGDTTISIFNDQQNQKFEFNIIGIPNSLQFDPNNWILKSSSISTDTGVLTFPVNFELKQNFPNPFNPSTKIEYNIPLGFSASPFNEGGIDGGLVSLKIYNLLGSEVATLVNEYKQAGKYEVEFNPSSFGLTSGVYFYQLKVGNLISTKKMMLLK